MRNTALHMATPSVTVNEGLQRWFEKGLTALGIDPNDPATTFYGTRFQILPLRIDEDATGNSLHLLLIAAAILSLTFRKETRNRETVALAAALVAGLILFSAYLRWQPWHMRLHLPLFVLWSAVIGACSCALAFVGYAGSRSLRRGAAGFRLACAAAAGAAVLLYPPTIFSMPRGCNWNQHPRATIPLRNWRTACRARTSASMRTTDSSSTLCFRC